MKTDFSARFFHNPLAVASAAQTAVGIAQTIGGWVQQRKATKELEKLKSPSYTQNKSILDFYNQALSRYNVSPTASAMYKRQVNNIGRGTATGINAFNDRRSGQAGISSLIRNQNDAMLNAEVAAENQQNQRFGQLGGAANMKAGEDRLAFDINENQPYERKYNLLSQKAGGGAQIMNAGISNTFGGLQNFSNIEMLKKMYPEKK